MSIVAPEQPSTAAPPSAQPVARPRIVANRKLLTRRFPSLGFTISSGGLPFWEVLLFTDRSLIDPRNASKRTPATFYTSRQDGGLRRAATSGDDVFLVPSAVMRGFAAVTPKPTAIYFTVAAYADAAAASPVFPAPPELLALDAPSVQVSPDFTPDAVGSVLGVSASRLKVVAQSLDTAQAPQAAAAPAPAATPAPAPAPAAAPAPTPAPAAPVDPAEDAAAGEDGYSFYANHPDLVAGNGGQTAEPAPANASPPPRLAVAEPHDPQPYDDGYGAYDDGWGREEGWAGAQSASFPAGFGEPAPLLSADAPAAELGGVERIAYSGLDEPDGVPAPAPAPAPVAATPAPSPAPTLTIADKLSILEHIAGEAGADRYGAVNADGEYKGRFGPDHPAYHHHHLGLSFGVVQFTQESGNLGRLLAMMKQRDEAAFARIFGEHADELIAVTTAAGPPSSESTDGRSARTQPVGGADLWEEPWLSRFRAAGAEATFQAAQNELASALFIDPVLRFAGDLGLDTDRALTIVVDRAAQLGCDPAKQWIVAAVGPIQTQALRQQALSALGFSDLASFQRSRGLEPDNLFGPDTHAALAGALRGLGSGAPIQLSTVDQMLDGLVRRADADNTYWAASVKRLRTATDFTDKPYARS
jgi:hypothetical protein